MPAPKRGLGRGLDALLPDAEITTELPLSAIAPRSDQPRQRFAEKELTELAYSIRQHGILQPLVVMPSGTGDNYTLLAGERRYRAAQIAGLSRVPVYVRDSGEDRHHELALIENIQRADLTPMEEARAFQRLMEEDGLTQEELAKRLGKSRSTIANSVRLLQLPEEITQALQEGRISAGHANALLARSGGEQATLFHAIQEQKLSVRQAEAWRRSNGPHTSPRQGSVAMRPAWIGEIEKRLGTKVGWRGSSTKGHLLISYESREELDRLATDLELADHSE